MNIGLIKFLLLAQTGVALRLTQDQQNKATLTAALESRGCVDRSNELVHPLVSAMKTFLPTQGVNIMPMALTSLAAVRFGGISMEFDQKARSYDHDLDIFVTLGDKHPTKSDIDRITGSFLAYLNKTGYQAYHCIQMHDGNLQTKWEFLEQGVLNSTWLHDMILVDTPSETTAEYPDFLQELERQGGTWKKMMDSWDMPCRDKWRNGTGTLIDFWWKMEGVIVSKQPKTTEKMLLAGVDFDVLMGDDDILDSWLGNLCRPWGRQWPAAKGMDISAFCDRKVDYCDFATPTFANKPYLFFDADENYLVNKINNVLPWGSYDSQEAVFKDCAQVLDAHGYKSFTSCNKALK